MKTIFLFAILLSIFNTDLRANEPSYCEGSYLTVVARSGMRLRMEPSMGSKTVRVIPYGEDVCVENTYGFEESLSERIGWADGHWILVSYSGTYGYMFDAFLSTFGVPTHEHSLCLECTSFVFPLQHFLGSNYKILYDELDGEASDYSMVRITGYDEGISLRQSSNGDWIHFEFTFRENSMQEVLNLLRTMIVGKQRRDAFESGLVFHENSVGQISKIVIGETTEQLTIQLNGDGSVSLSTALPCMEEGC